VSTGPDHEPAGPSHAPAKRSPIVGIDDPDDLAPPPEAPAGEHLDDLLPKQPTERSVSRRVGFAIAGAVLILIGLVIWITPVIGGSPFFIIPGLILLARASEPVRRAVNFGDRQLPQRVRGFMRWARDRVTRSKKKPPAQPAESDDTSPSPSPRDGL
jgi:hypothetical protein